MTGAPAADPTRFGVDTSESAVLIDARSTAGRITFGTNEIGGTIDVAVFDGALLMTPPPAAAISVDLRSLRSGNSLFDAELAQRLNVRRFPRATVSLGRARLVANRYQVSGSVTLHNQTLEMSGSVSAERVGDGWLVSGEQVFDIRDFEISVPSLVMLKIFPDVRVFLSLMLRPGIDPHDPAGEV